MYNPAGVYVASAYFSPGTHTRGYFVLFGAFWRAGNHGDGDDEGDAPLLPGFHRLSSLPPPHTHTDSNLVMTPLLRLLEMGVRFLA